ncbi:glycosyltransferase [Clostridium formicaceticum]|uniref:Teichuronic acid biosynthesis glycosyltransferase TuaH n=1 Tax=Clostridium formicaceticum TaxID=1497 RepID=A0AAC9WEN7_9CLOT|nr:glycosyltransferase [Clostridium formicaceticum]AOY75534.1 hypothetical protein BJL90_06265 [Clostridium formicaceticum]ARE85828.1 Putative teichuronic acid biosynthesis glycosyltransferase TuaH [Clostridium formicaceticum]
MDEFKYNYKIDMESDTTAAKVAKLVGYNKHVLDIGCATGYMAEVLEKHFNCDVVGIEIDQEAAKVAAKFCKKVIVGNIEELNLSKELDKCQFDVIIFSDVLEHLKNPWEVLSQIKGFLKRDGYIVASIPNITHSSVVLELLKGKFNYKERGLLDNTHLRFFTKESITDLFESIGYYIESIDRKRILPEDTEFNIELKEFPGEIIEYLKNNEEYTTYQFIIKAYKATEHKAIEMLRKKLVEKEKILENIKTEYRQLEKDVKRYKGNIEEHLKVIEQKDRDITVYIQNIKDKEDKIEELFRVLESKDADIKIYLENIELKDQKNQELLEIIELKDSIISSHLDTISQKGMIIEQFSEVVETKEKIKGRLDSRIEDMQEILSQLNEVINQLEIERYEKEIKENEINNLESKNRELSTSMQNKEQEISKLENQLNLIYMSGFWKLATRYYRIRDNVWPLNKVYQYVKKKKLRKAQNLRLSTNNESNQTAHEDSLSTSPLIKQQNIEASGNITFKPHLASKDSSKYDIIFFSIIDWEFRYQRPQHIASYMANQGYRVFYFNVNFTSSNLAIKDKGGNLKIVTLPNDLGSRIYDVAFDQRLSHIANELNRIIVEYGIKSSVIFVEYPNWQPLATYLKDKYGYRIIFDYLDDFTGFNTNNITLVEYNDKLFDSSDRIIATSQFLHEKAKIKTEEIDIVRNGTEFSHFNKAHKLSNKKAEGKSPVIGYYGAIAEWFDMGKIEYLAKTRPDWEIVLIGDYSYANVNEASKLSNIKFLGEKPYKELPEYLKNFDVCIIPFKADRDLIKATNPVKFYEYLSAGKKIVATEIPELMAFSNKFVYLTNDNEKFAQYIEKCLNNSDDLAPLEEKLEFARSQDWENRCKDIQKIIKKTHKLASIIIVTYNNLKYTKECINSILEKTSYPNYEIIIVDNQSKDDTAEYLKELDKNYSHIKVILNDENYGFAKGNNVGIKEAQGDYIILLNNDTVVTRGWLSGLIKHLDREQQLGLIGPVTNSIGNEAKINVPYTNIKDMDDFAEDYTSKNFNTLYRNIEVLAMFCVAMRRDVFEQVGYLDETFGIGMFEDDDYSYRIKEKGYYVACAEDIFIHHYGSASFSKLQDKTYRELFEKNKKIFEEKWNMNWTPHSYREGVN